MQRHHRVFIIASSRPRLIASRNSRSSKTTHISAPNMRISAHPYALRFGYSLLSQSLQRNPTVGKQTQKERTTMSAQDNAVLARRIYQLFSEDKFDHVLELVSPDIETILVPFGQTFHGREGF